MTELINNHI